MVLSTGNAEAADALIPSPNRPSPKNAAVLNNILMFASKSRSFIFDLGWLISMSEIAHYCLSLDEYIVHLTFSFLR
jgi:hypothetical protein